MIFQGIPLVEPIPVPDSYVEGIGRIEDAGGGNLRVYFYAKQNDLHSGEPIYVVTDKVVVSAANIDAACRICLAAASGVITADEAQRLVRLVN